MNETILVDIEKEEKIKIKCPLCQNYMMDITQKTPKLMRNFKFMFVCKCEKVVLIIQGR
jgi:hypothetical protein